MKIKWNKSAVKQLFDIIEYLEENDLSEYGLRVEKDILSRIRALPSTFETYPPDRYKLNNDNTFRAFEYDRYRISFRVKNNEIRILRIRHTRRLPKIH